MSDHPLTNIRILDLSRLLPGPYLTFDANVGRQYDAEVWRVRSDS